MSTPMQSLSDTGAAPQTADALPMAQRIIPLVVASALFMDLMDSAALSTALPTMARALRVEAVDLKLALTAYLFTVAALVPASGWLVDRFGAKRVFMAAMAIFVAGSICCSMAVSIETLVAARILQGIGGAMMTPVGRSIVVLSMPKSALTSAMSMFTIPAIIAPLIGPPLAGLLIAKLSWRWIFLINIPVGIAGLIAIWLLVPKLPAPADKKFDFRGFSILFIFIVCLMLIADIGSFSVEMLLSRVPMILAAIASGLLYAWHARRCPAPVIDVSLLRRRSVFISLASCVLQRMLIAATPFLLSLMLQEGLHFSPLRASNVMLAMAAGGMISRFLAPPVIEWMGFRKMMLVFSTITCALTVTPAFFTTGTPLAVMVGTMLILSMIRTMFFVPATTLLYEDVEAEEVQHATVLHTVCQQLSLGMGISAAAILLSIASHGSSEITPDIFLIPFAGMALIGMLTVVVVWPLPADAGSSFRKAAARN